jgi:hypothetical protein
MRLQGDLEDTRSEIAGLAILAKSVLHPEIETLRSSNKMLEAEVAASRAIVVEMSASETAAVAAISSFNDQAVCLSGFFGGVFFFFFFFFLKLFSRKAASEAASRAARQELVALRTEPARLLQQHTVVSSHVNKAGAQLLAAEGTLQARLKVVQKLSDQRAAVEQQLKNLDSDYTEKVSSL